MVINTMQDNDLEYSASCPILDTASSVEVCDAAEDAPPRPPGVLVIEDERLMLRAMEQGLQQRGFVVWTAANGREGVDLYRHYQSQIDIALSDVQMAVLDGPQTLEILREINPSVRCSFMTGDSRAVTRGNLLSQGSLRVFMKPFSSFSEVTNKLWQLATRPDEFCDPRESNRSDTSDVDIVAESTLSNEQRAGNGYFPWRVSSRLRSVTRVHLLFCKTRGDTPTPSPST